MRREWCKECTLEKYPIATGFPCDDCNWTKADGAAPPTEFRAKEDEPHA